MWSANMRTYYIPIKPPIVGEGISEIKKKKPLSPQQKLSGCEPLIYMILLSAEIPGFALVTTGPSLRPFHHGCPPLICFPCSLLISEAFPIFNPKTSHVHYLTLNLFPCSLPISEVLPMITIQHFPWLLRNKELLHIFTTQF